MDDVERLVSQLQVHFATCSDKDELKAVAHRKLAAFIGRAALREGGYAPAGEVAGLLTSARSRLQALRVEGPALYVRSDLLNEIDRTITAIAPRRLPPLKL